ncbi:MAG: hypothetical protein OEY64_00695 [Nitrospinota bacterium]|nr:hypothetical protein [Nitrospinota bacterium]
MSKNNFIIFAALIAISLAGCSSEEKAEKKTSLPEELAARKLYEKAASLEKNGNQEEANAIYLELTEKYSKTKTFENLRNILEQKGVSIEDPLVSKTAKRMFALQNIVVRYKERNGVYPKVSALKTENDMWGSPLVLEIGANKKVDWEFVIISMGPDGRLKTKDDLYLVYAGEKSETAVMGDLKSKPKRQSIKSGISIDELGNLSTDDSSMKKEAKTDEKSRALNAISSEGDKKKDNSRGRTGNIEQRKGLDDL